MNGGDRKAQRSATNTDPSVSHFNLLGLPLAVMYAILIKLPVVSIMSLKPVCKALYNLINSREFSVEYSKNSKFATFLIENDHSRQPPGLRLLQISDNREFINTKFQANVPDWPERGAERGSSFYIIGTCNGLVCFMIDYKHKTQTVYICNPVRAQEYIAIAEHEVKEGDDIIVEYGFSFCSSTNSYKVLKMVGKEKNDEEPEISILTIGIDYTWRVLDTVAMAIHGHRITLPITPSDHITCNESLYWIAMDVDSFWICAFDFNEEKISELAHPHEMDLDFWYMNLASIDNHFCIIDTSNSFEIVIWKMRDYGFVESWTKDFVLDLSVIPTIQPRNLCLVTILENRDMIFCHDLRNYTILYNPKTRRFMRIEITCLGSIRYSPSFLSPSEIIGEANLSTVKVLLL